MSNYFQNSIFAEYEFTYAYAADGARKYSFH